MPAAAVGERRADRSEIRSAVTRFLVVGLVVLAAVSVPSTLIMRHLTRAHTLHELGASVERMATNLVARLVTSDVLGPDADVAASQRLADGVDVRVADGSMERISIWDRTGLVVYSTETSLIGNRYPEHDWDAAVLEDGVAVATFQDDGVPLYAYEPDHGRFVEVDVAFMSAAGESLILETYFSADVVHGQQRDLLLKLLPVGLLTLLALQVAQLPPAVRLASSVQHLQTGRRRLMAQTVAASDHERRRIARDLHDDVIQELVGVSYALESVTSRDAEVEEVVDQARGLVRKNIASLRGMLTEIYPADLDSVGLQGALAQQARRLRDAGLDVRLTMPDAVDVGPTAALLLYRLAREAVSNTLKHAQASTATVDLSVSADGATATFTLADDGVGFDLGASSADGHLGLRLMRDMVSEMGGRVDVMTAAGQGTTILATIPLV